jgi:toxin-antitoxin system PIN domain toxin
MILPDINLLVYAHNIRAPHHERALQWWNQCLIGNESVALAWAVILGFVRVVTHPRVFQRPMSVRDSTERVAEWLSLPHVHIVHPAEDHFARWSSLLEEIGIASNLTTDAHLATLAIERGLVLHTTDVDFARFRGLKWTNPLR